MTSLEQFISANSDVLVQLPSNKIKCLVTNHEMPPDLSILQAHLQSKNFQKKKEWYQADYSQYLPYIVPHKSNPKLLYCTLSRTRINKIPEIVAKHVNGKRFKR